MIYHAVCSQDTRSNSGSEKGDGKVGWKCGVWICEWLVLNIIPALHCGIVVYHSLCVDREGHTCTNIHNRLYERLIKIEFTRKTTRMTSGISER